ncbi:MAG: LuxR C-terminal-related transcriptional regulator [Kordiimonas sp.]
MYKTVLQYGGLLALFLVALETARRSYLVQFTSIELYVAVVAVIFLALGGWAAQRIFKRDNAEVSKKLKVLDPSDFSERELDVLLFLCHGDATKDISLHPEIRANTLKADLKNISIKLQVSNRTQAAAEAKLLKIIG